MRVRVFRSPIFPPVVTDVLKIDNLWCFTRLVKLQLDNNIIERIEGLEALVNLRWLGAHPRAPSCPWTPRS